MKRKNQTKSVAKALLFIISAAFWCYSLAYAAHGFNGDLFALHRQSGMSQFVVKTDYDKNFFIDDAENGLGSWDEIAYNSGGSLAIPIPGYWDDDDDMDMAVYRTDKKKLYIKYASNGFEGTWHESYTYDVDHGSSFDVFALHRRNSRSLLVIKTDDDKMFHIDDADNGFGSFDLETDGAGGPLAIPVPGYWDEDDDMDMAVYRVDKKKLYIKYASIGFGGSWHESNVYKVKHGSSFDVFALHRRNSRSLVVIKTDNDSTFHIDDADNGFGSFDLETDGAGGPLAIPVPGYWDEDDDMDMAVYRTDKKKLYIKYASIGFGGSWHDSFQYEINHSEANLGGDSLGPTMTVGLHAMTEDEIRDDSFRITAYEPGSDDPLPYRIKDKNNDSLLNVAAGEQTRVKYIGDDTFTIYNYDSGVADEEITTEGKVNFQYKNVGDENDIYFDIHHSSYGSSYDKYRDKIQLNHYDPSGGSNDRVWIINFLPMEHYVWGMGEITGTGDRDYNRTMTISYRTYGYWKRKYSTAYAAQGFKVNATPGNQIYRGYVWETTYDRIRPAAEVTRGKIVMYGDRIAITPYSSWTDGRTRSFEERWGSENYPWCQSVSDPWGDYNGDYWNNGAHKSTSTLVAEGNHMVGLSAHGALDRAGEGWSYSRILKYYFTGIDIHEAY